MKKRDNDLEYKLKQEIPLILQKISKAYLYYVNKLKKKWKKYMDRNAFIY